MASIIVIPIVIVAIIGLVGYLVYKYAMYDYFCKRSVMQTLKKYSIKKTPAQIIREYHKESGESLSEKQVRDLEKYCRQKDPDRFLSMYDDLRENEKDDRT